jgi:hypothetical protein
VPPVSGYGECTTNVFNPAQNEEHILLPHTFLSTTDPEDASFLDSYGQFVLSHSEHHHGSYGMTHETQDTFSWQGDTFNTNPAAERPRSDIVADAPWNFTPTPWNCTSNQEESDVLAGGDMLSRDPTASRFDDSIERSIPGPLYRNSLWPAATVEMPSVSEERSRLAEGSGSHTQGGSAAHSTPSLLFPDSALGSSSTRKEYALQSSDKYGLLSILDQVLATDISFHPSIPYCCDHCGKAFRSKHSLSHHERIHDPAERERHMCQYCNRAFRHPKDLRRHMDAVHMKVKIVCEKCDRAFSRRDNLIRHTRDVHDSHSGARSEIM